MTCKPEPEVQWFHNDTLVTADGWYQIESERGVHRLTLPSAKVEDNGTWRCLASNVYGQTMCTGKLEVIGKSSIRAQFIEFCMAFIGVLHILCCCV